jgi:hypothetical protein
MKSTHRFATVLAGLLKFFAERTLQEAFARLSLLRALLSWP